MELETLRKINRGILAVALSVGGTALVADCAGNSVAQHNARPATVSTEPKLKPGHTTPTTNPLTTEAAPTTHPTVRTSPATETQPSKSTATTPETAVQKKSEAISKKLARVLLRPTKTLVALHVGSKLQEQFSGALFVAGEGKGKDCAVIVGFTPDHGKVDVEVDLFGRPNDITNPKVINGPGAYDGKIGHGGDTDEVSTGLAPVQIVDSTLPAIEEALSEITEKVCVQLSQISTTTLP